ncbi:FixH family protein [Aestuariivirga sp.]|uniref:FixH family protein n=1 Tax=Aestuariivirga sp. TaxID=2650926 RepID=UPI0035930E00
MLRYIMKAAALGTVLLTNSVTASADIKDYEFQLVTNELKQGEAEVVVKLVRKPSGDAVPDAVIFAQRIDMGPDGMETMQSSIEAIASTEPGTYRFKTNLTMVGNRAFSLAAKIQGETGTLENKLVLKATK